MRNFSKLLIIVNVLILVILVPGGVTFAQQEPKRDITKITGNLFSKPVSIQKKPGLTDQLSSQGKRIHSSLVTVDNIGKSGLNSSI